MIAASDPQEFVPSGRQQALEHPGPVDNVKNKSNNYFDDYLLTKLEKVSLADDKQSEWWTLRKVSLNGNEKNAPEQESAQKHLYTTKSPYCSDLFSESCSSKSFSRLTNKRWSATSELNITRTQHNSSASIFDVKQKSNYVEEELYVKGGTVVWSRGLITANDKLHNDHKILSCYTCPHTIKQAIWCTFHCERPTFNQNQSTKAISQSIPAICIIDSHHVRVFMSNGEDFVLPIPFEIKRVWSTLYGILIERNADSSSKDALYDHPSTIYSLAYPLDDICPIAINQPTSGIQLLNNNHVTLVFTSEKPSICMLFDRQTKQHSVYFVRKVKSTEKICQFNASKKKLSIWENLINGNNLATPSPALSSKTPSLTSFLQPSRSHSTKTSFSRCHSSALGSSSWLLQTSFRQHMRNIDVAPSVTDRSFFDCSKAMSHVMASPEICLDHIWTDSYSFHEATIAAPASKVFLCDDLTSQWYLCYVLPTRYQLSIVQIDFSNVNNIQFGILTSISAKDAIPIPALHMLAILEHNGNISLYSGLNLVGKLHIGGTLVQHTPSPCIRRNIPLFNSPFPRRSSLLPHCKPSDAKFDEHLLSPVLPSVPQVPTTIQMNFLPTEFDGSKTVLNQLTDPIENRITLKYSDGTCYRIILPNLANSTLVANCLKTIRSCLHRDAALTFLSRWYASRNVLGTQDLTAEQEWSMFVQLLYDLLGYEGDQISECSKEVPVTPSCERDKKRSKPSIYGDEDDFQYLINNAVQNKNKIILEDLLNVKLASVNAHKAATCLNTSINSNAILFPYIQLIHYALHLMYEDFKLDTNSQNDLLPLMQLLNKLSNDLGLWKFSLHYWYDFPQEAVVKNKTILRESDRKLLITCDWLNNEPVNVFSHIYKLLKNEEMSLYPFMESINMRSKDIVQLCGLISRQKHFYDSFVKNVSIFPQQNEEELFDKTNSSSQLVLLMVKMGITVDYLNTLPFGLRLLFYNKLWQFRESPPTNWPMEAYLLILREDLAAHLDNVKRTDGGKGGLYNRSQLQEQSVANVTQDAEQIDGMEDCDNTIMKLRFSDDIRVQETRKMLNSSKPVPIVLVQRPDVSDHDFIEEQEKHLYAICTRTMALPVGRGMFTLRTVAPLVTEPLQSPSLCLLGKAPPHGSTVELTHIDTPTHMNVWPLFHNGVANGLRITPDAENINDTWITFNKPTNQPKSGHIDHHVEHSGFLMALGLNGHLKNLAFLSTYEYFVKLHELLTVGLLIGLAATYRGTTNVSIMKMLSIHIEALLPPTSMELDVPQNLQVAALFGVGLLYEGTAHRHIAEVLLSEIGRPPGPEMENSVDRESYSLAAGLALGLVTLQCGGNASGLSDLNLPDNLLYYMIGGNKRMFTGTQKDKYKVASFQIREGSTVNLDVTSPGATLALGLMYLGSGNKAVADWMTPPATQYLLDFVRPDFLMLRILSKSLIMWNDIEASKEWIEAQVPSTIRPYCMVQPTTNLDIDYEAMNQAYCNIISGACFALGLRFAGTANEDAFETLLHYCHMFTSLTGKSIAELAGKPTIETCLNVLLLSASMVMAGTGNLEIMRLIRHLRRRVGVSSTSIVTYGSHLAIHMALGLLFLGGGRYTLSNHPKSVAALICAFYPKFPTHSNDNRYHLQAFRHLYVLAIEMRLIIPKDVFLEKCCYVNLKLVYLTGECVKVKAPGLLPDLELLDKVMVDDERYWQVVFERGHNWEILLNIMSSTGCVEVKQHAGCLSHTEDKYGYRSELARTLTQSEIVPWDPSPSNIISFSSDKSIKMFCDHFLKMDSMEYEMGEKDLCQMLTKLTYDAVTKDKQVLIPIFTALMKCLNDFERTIHVVNVWQLKLVQVQVLENDFTSLLSDEVVLAVRQKVKNVLNNWNKTRLGGDLFKYLNGKDLGTIHGENVEKLAAYVTYFDLPYNCVKEVDGNWFNNRNYKLNEFRNCVEMFQMFLE